MDSNTSQAPEQKANGKAVASLVLGILAIVSLFTGWGSIIGLVFGIVAIVLAVKAKKEDGASGLATAGLVCAIIGTVVAGIGILCFACAAAVGTAIVDSLS